MFLGGLAAVAASGMACLAGEPELDQDLGTSEAAIGIQCSGSFLRTQKSYVHDLDGGSYRMHFGVASCSGSYQVLSYTGMVEFQATQRVNPTPDTPGYLDLLADGAMPPPATFQRFVDAGFLDTSYRGPKTAVLYRARPASASHAWSNWVQVNHGTKHALMRTSDYWKTSPTGVGFFFDGGVNYAYQPDVSFKSKVVNKPVGTVTPPPGEPTPQASFEMVFVKNKDAGYMVPSHPFDPGSQNPWTVGDAHCAHWLNVQSFAPFHAQERFLVINGGACFHRNSNPWHAETTQTWQTSSACSYANTAPGTCWFYAGEAFYAKPADGNTGLRNYMLAPEFVGPGWGVALVFTFNGIQRFWGAEADLYPAANAIPGLGGTSPVLQLSLRELVPLGSSAGHREDWYFDSSGLVRIEDRMFGGDASSCTPSTNSRCPRLLDPDFALRGGFSGKHYQPIIKYPHYCMTRDGKGSCTLNR